MKEERLKREEMQNNLIKDLNAAAKEIGMDFSVYGPGYIVMDASDVWDRISDEHSDILYHICAELVLRREGYSKLADKLMENFYKDEQERRAHSD